MKELVSPNSSEMIKKLNQTKQYTLMATGLLESIVTDPNLTASAAKLWEYLYTKAIMNEKLSVKIRYKDLAEKFKRSERTIKRQVENLKGNGYLRIESNFHAHGQRANTFYLEIPDALVMTLDKTKDRSALKPSQKSKIDKIGEWSSVEEKEICIIDDRNKEDEKDDKIVTPDHDKNVIPINNIKKDIIINNNSVVVFLPDQDMKSESIKADENDKQDTVDEEEIKKMKEKLNPLYIKMGNLAGKEQIAVLDEIKALQARINAITLTMQKRKQTMNTLISQERSSFNPIKPLGFVDSSINFAKINGERNLSPLEENRIKKALQGITMDAQNQNKIFNEITYAIRFGALRVGQNGGTLTIAHAISIAIKLLRENRWQTPAPFLKKEKSIFNFQKHSRVHYSSMCRG